MGTPPEENKPNVTNEPVSPTEEGIDFFRSNLWDIVAYIFLTMSLLYSFFDQFVGQVPVGFILGLYFSEHIFNLFAQFRVFLIEEGIFRGFVVIVGIAALVIAAPGLCLGLFGGTVGKTFFPSSGQE